MDEISENERKDILIAWAYRYVSEREAVGEFFTSVGIEFRAAAESLVHDVETLSQASHYHPDIATRGA